MGMAPFPRPEPTCALWTCRLKPAHPPKVRGAKAEIRTKRFGPGPRPERPRKDGCQQSASDRHVLAPRTSSCPGALIVLKTDTPSSQWCYIVMITRRCFALTALALASGNDAKRANAWLGLPVLFVSSCRSRLGAQQT